MLKFLGSIYFAAVLLAGLAILLSVSTWMESAYGTPFAQRLVYQAGWFDAFLLLLAVNILLSTLSRWPFKKKHTGFVMTHIGILILLGGSLASRLFGVDGQLLLEENRENDHITLGQYELVTEGRGGEEESVLDIGKKPARSYRSIGKSGYEILIHRIADEAQVEEAAEEGGPSDAPNPAFHIELKSQAMGANLSAWIMRSNPFREEPKEASAGPAKLMLLEEAPSGGRAPSLHIKKDARVLLHWQADDPKGPSSIQDGDARIAIENFRYLPDAKVGEGGKMISASDEPLNPAVEFTLRGADGSSKRYLKFANFPDFESMHGKKGEDPFELSVTFAGGSPKITGPSLVFYPKDGGWAFESRNRAGEIKAQGPVKVGESQAAGWVDFQFTVTQHFERARVFRRVLAKTGGQDGPALDLSIRKDATVLAREWLLANQTLALPGSDSVLMLRQRTQRVPFVLKLLDFRKVDYPGTNRPASFESDVQLTDPAQKIEIKRTIRMNEPLDYAGYRIFQSSYIQDGGFEASVFTVAKNPGILWIYSGSIILFAGVFVTFFIPPFSSFRRNP